MKNKNEYIEAAQQIIVSLGLPRAQQNERSALCLLALLNLTPGKAWADAENPMIGITPIMDWARVHYDKEYAPNTREDGTPSDHASVLRRWSSPLQPR